MRNIAEIKKKQKKFKLLYYILIVGNILLFILSIYQFILSDNKFSLDRFFIILMVANIATLYLTYKIYDKYNFLKYQFEHFNNLKK
jgi:amino acid permease